MFRHALLIQAKKLVKLQLNRASYGRVLGFRSRRSYMNTRMTTRRGFLFLLAGTMIAGCSRVPEGSDSAGGDSSAAAVKYSVQIPDLSGSLCAAPLLSLIHI